MAFYEIQPDVIQDRDTGRMMKVDRDTVTQLRNNGQLLPSIGSGLRGEGSGGAPAPVPPGPQPVGATIPVPSPVLPPDETIIGAAPQSSPSPTRSPLLPALQGIPQEYGGAPPQPERGSGTSRVSLRGRQQQEQQQGNNGLPPGLVLERVGATRGGMIPQGERISGITPGQQENLVSLTNEAAAMEAKAIMSQAEVKQQQAQAEKNFYELNSLELQNKGQELRQSIEARQTFTDNEVSRLNELIDTAAKEKPSATIFGDGDAQGIAGGVLAMIGLGLAQYASGVTGAKNPVTDMINAAIDQKLQSQREQIRERLKSSTEQRDDLRQAYRYYDSRDQNLLAAVETKSYMNALESIMADADMKAAHPMAEQAYAQLGQRLSQLLLPSYQAIQQEATRRYVPGSPGGTRVMVDPLLKAQAEVADLQKRINEGSGARAPEGQAAVYGGSGEVVGTIEKDVAKKLNDEAVATKKIVHILDQVEELQRKGGKLSPKDRAWLESLDVLGALQLAQSLSFRVGTEEDFNRASSAIGSGNWDYFTNSNAFKASQMKKLAIDGINKSYSHFGFNTAGMMEELTNRSRLSE